MTGMKLIKANRRRLGVAIVLALIVSFTKHLSLAQPPQALPNAGQIKINLQGPTPLSTLTEYVSNRLGLRFIYDNSLSQQQINLQVSDEIPLESLFDLLQSALQINGLAIAQTETEGWYRIVTNASIPKVSIPAGTAAELQAAGAAMPVTRVFSLRRGDPSQIKSLIEPFLTSPGSNVIAVAANKTLIATDIASNLRRIALLIELLDAEQFSSSVRFVEARNVTATDLADKLRTILEAKTRTETAGPTLSDGQANANVSVGVEIAVNERLNQLILIGLPAQIDASIEILNLLDTPLASTTQAYRPRFLSPEQLDTILKSWIDSQAPRPQYESRIEGPTLIVTTSDSIQRQLAALGAQVDSRETSAEQSPIRFYKIRNVRVQDILETLNSLQGGFGANPFPQGNEPRLSRARTTNDLAVPGANTPFLVNGASAQPGLLPPNPPALRNGLSGVNNQSNQINNQGFEVSGAAGGLNPGPFGFGVGGINGFPINNGLLGGGLPFQRGIQSPLGSAQVTADLGSNTLIIIAQPDVQQAYQQLIEFLDKRRPQVMIEARIVIVDTSDNFQLGVEVSGGDRTGASRLFAFSSFGLSQVNPINGALTINPGTGFNATLVDPNTADVVVRALTTHRRAKVLSAPQILVDDNAEGTLTSVNEIPFTSVNASQTVATTSFAGFAEAGTTITVTPTISEARHINLEYVVTLNSFTGTGSAGVPPPRQTNEISSRVTVPDGYTIIVGGLSQKNETATMTGIPILENIPVLRELSSLRNKNFSETTLFVFLRPIVLENDKFRDLRYLSKKASRKADEAHNFPVSQPLVMQSPVDCE